MEILRAIERADALCPNPYTLEEKLSWCDEVTAEIRRNIIKIYDMIETEIGGAGELLLPEDIPFERIELAFVGDRRLEKQDFRSFVSGFSMSNSGFGAARKIKVVFLTMPEPIRTTEIYGEFNTGDSIIEIETAPFTEGDRIEIVHLSDLETEPDWSSAELAYVIEVQPDKIILDHDAVPAQTGAYLAIRRVVDEVTAVDEAPYDGMYIEYILAKMALYQHDYVGYNAHMTQYNTLYETLRREYKTRNPLTTQVRFKNYSVV